MDLLEEDGDLLVQRLMEEEAVKLIQQGKSSAAVQAGLDMKLAKDSLKLISSILVAHRESRLSEEEYEGFVDLISKKHRNVAVLESLQRGGGNIVTFGKSDLQLGYVSSNNIQVTPKRVDFPSLVSSNYIRQVSASEHHTVAIDNCGRVWTWGHGLNGRLGLGDEDTRILPTPISRLHSIVQISAGRDHTLAVSNRGKIFGWGSNEKSQLGVKLPNGHHSTLNPVRIRLPGDAQVHQGWEPKCRQVAASSSHSIAIDRHGKAYGWGSNEKGQLMQRDFVSVVKEPRRFTALCNKRMDNIKQVCASDGITLLLTKQGYVLQAGRGSHSPYRVNIRSANCVAEDISAGWQAGNKSGDVSVKISSISCGPNHAAAISKEGHLYTWGTYANLLGHTGKGCNRDPQKSHTNHAMRVASLEQTRIVSVSCAKNHTCAVDEHGHLYTWGIGDFGVLGTRGGSGRHHETYQPVPKRVPCLKGVTHVHAAESHTVVVIAPSRPEFDPFLNESEENPAIVHGGSDDEMESSSSSSEEESEDEDEAFFSSRRQVQTNHKDGEVPSLKYLCEKTLASTVNFWNVLHIWLFAQEIYSDLLEDYCEQFAFQNLDAVIVNNRDADDFIAELSGTDPQEIDNLVAIFKEPRENNHNDEEEHVDWDQNGSPENAANNADSPTMKGGCLAFDANIHDEIETPKRTRSGSTSPISFKSPLSSPLATASTMNAKLSAQELGRMSVPRLRKQVGACHKSIELLEDIQLKYLVATPEFNGSAKKSSRLKKMEMVEKQIVEMHALIGTLEQELASRFEKDPFEDHSELHCALCGVKVSNQEAMVYHVAGKRHRKNLAQKQREVEWQPTVVTSEAQGGSSHKRSSKKIYIMSSQPQNMKQRFAKQSCSSSSPWTGPVSPQPAETPSSLLDIQNEQRHTPASKPRGSNHRQPSMSFSLPPSNMGLSESPPKSRSLMDFMTPSSNKSQRKQQQHQQASAWSAKKSGEQSIPPPEPAPIRSVLLDFAQIQQEQIFESSKKQNVVDLTASSWGLCERNKEDTLLDIQLQQELEMESERLARELAAQEGVQQNRLMKSIKQKEKNGTNNKKKKKKGTKGSSTTANTPPTPQQVPRKKSRHRKPRQAAPVCVP